MTSTIELLNVVGTQRMLTQNNPKSEQQNTNEIFANKPAEPRSRFSTCYTGEIGTRLAGCVMSTIPSAKTIRP